jgi:hypothetical protein
MAKATYKCTCGKTKVITFNPGEKIDEVICECGKPMSRQFGVANVGYIEEDDLLAVGHMMTYQAPSVVR